MKGIVLDASVTLSWCFPDEQTLMALGMLDRLKAGEWPSFWPVEVLGIRPANAPERRRRIWVRLDAYQRTDPAAAAFDGAESVLRLVQET